MWNIGAKFGESPHSRTRTRRKNFGFTYHESSPPDLQPSTSGTKLAPQYQSECGRYGSAETLPSLRHVADGALQKRIEPLGSQNRKVVLRPLPSDHRSPYGCSC